VIKVSEHVVESKTLPAWTDPAKHPPALAAAAAGGIVIRLAADLLLARLARFRLGDRASSGSARGARLGADALPEPDG